MAKASKSVNPFIHQALESPGLFTWRVARSRRRPSVFGTASPTVKGKLHYKRVLRGTSALQCIATALQGIANAMWSHCPD